MRLFDFSITAKLDEVARQVAAELLLFEQFAHGPSDLAETAPHQARNFR